MSLLAALIERVGELKAIEQSRELVRERGPKRKRLAGDWVREAQALGVEKQPVDSKELAKEAVMAALTVINVADKGMPDMRHMPANLVHAPGLGLDFGERVARRRIAAHRVGELDMREAPKMGEGLGRVFSGLFNEGSVDAPSLGEDAARDSEVCLFYAPLGKGVGEGPGRAGIEGKNEDTRGAPIEAMDRIDPAAELVAEEAQAGGPIGGRLGAVDDEAAWLGDRGEEGVLVKELDHGFKAALWRRGRWTWKWAGGYSDRGDEGYNAPL